MRIEGVAERQRSEESLHLHRLSRYGERQGVASLEGDRVKRENRIDRIERDCEVVHRCASRTYTGREDVHTHLGFFILRQVHLGLQRRVVANRQTRSEETLYIAQTRSVRTKAHLHRHPHLIRSRHRRRQVIMNEITERRHDILVTEITV